ncbi:hypothetical protein D3C74_318710 [compost metagenome]
MDLAHPFDEQNHSQHQSNLHRHGQVGKDGQQEGNEQHQRIPCLQLEQMKEFLALAHIPGHYHQNRRHCSQRNTRRIRSKQQQNEEYHHTVDYTRQGGSRPAFDIGCRSCNRPGSGNPAEQRSSYIGNPLADQFSVAVVAAARHAVCHHCGQQRLNRAQHGNYEGRAKQQLHPFPGNNREMEARQRIRDVPVG